MKPKKWIYTIGFGFLTQLLAGVCLASQSLSPTARRPLPEDSCRMILRVFPEFNPFAAMEMRDSLIEKKWQESRFQLEDLFALVEWIHSDTKFLQLRLKQKQLEAQYEELKMSQSLIVRRKLKLQHQWAEKEKQNALFSNLNFELNGPPQKWKDTIQWLEKRQNLLDTFMQSAKEKASQNDQELNAILLPVREELSQVFPRVVQSLFLDIDRGYLVETEAGLQGVEKIFKAYLMIVSSLVNANDINVLYEEKLSPWPIEWPWQYDEIFGLGSYDGVVREVLIEQYKKWVLNPKKKQALVSQSTAHEFFWKGLYVLLITLKSPTDVGAIKTLARYMGPETFPVRKRVQGQLERGLREAISLLQYQEESFEKEKVALEYRLQVLKEF